MDEQIREMLDVYAVEVDASRAQTFWYYEQRFSWSVIGNKHICMTRYGRDGRLHLTLWFSVDEDELVAKMNRYMQTVRYD